MKYRLHGLVERRDRVDLHLSRARLLQPPQRGRWTSRWQHDRRVFTASIRYARERIAAHRAYVAARAAERRAAERAAAEGGSVADGTAKAPSQTVPPAAPVSSGWSATAQCESSGDWAANTGNGYYGGLQFDSQTWDAYGDPSYAEASDAPASVQIAAAEAVPYDAWPNCP